MVEATGARSRGWRVHPARDRLLAEAHARPPTPLDVPTLATRLATLSGQAGGDADRAHMTALCRRLGAAEPGPESRWCALDAGPWRLRWERHTEFSTWTFFRRAVGGTPFADTALDLVPSDWLASLPGELLVSTHLELRGGAHVRDTATSGGDAIGAELADGAAAVFTDFRPDGQGMTRFLLLDERGEAALAGRLVQSLLEIETYRLMALLAFPLAGEVTAALGPIEAQAAELAARLAERGGPDSDRQLLGALAGLAGDAEALSARTTFRFGASAAYYGLVLERIANLREGRIAGLQTIGEFMARRLAPAMRTCDSAAARETAAIERIARTVQLLTTRVEVEAQANSAALLASMDRRARTQLRLQETVEGLSVVAISYYALQLLFYPLAAFEKQAPWLDAKLALGLLALPLVAMVWLAMRRLRRRVTAEIA